MKRNIIVAAAVALLFAGTGLASAHEGQRIDSNETRNAATVVRTFHAGHHNHRGNGHGSNHYRHAHKHGHRHHGQHGHSHHGR